MALTRKFRKFELPSSTHREMIRKWCWLRHESQNPCESRKVGHECIVALQHNSGKLFRVTRQKHRRCNESGHRAEQTGHFIIINACQIGVDTKLGVSFLWATAWGCLVGGLINTNGTVSRNTNHRTRSICLRINETSLDIPKFVWLGNLKSIGNDAPSKREECLLDTLVNLRRCFHETDVKFIREFTALLFADCSLLHPIRFVTNKNLINTFWGMLLNVRVPGPNVWQFLSVRLLGKSRGMHYELLKDRSSVTSYTKRMPIAPR